SRRTQADRRSGRIADSRGGVKDGLRARCAARPPDLRVPLLVNPSRIVGEDEILHLRERVLLIGLAEEHHHDHPADLVDVDLLGIEREQTVDDELALDREQDPDLLEMQEIAARGGVETLLLDAVEDAYG